MSQGSELRERLLREDPRFRHLAQKHREYEERLAVLRAKRFPTDEEKIEEGTLKKRKLALKDEMEEILRGAQTA